MLPYNRTPRAESENMEFAPMIAKVIHFGTDECHRLMVLRSAGYAVENCASLAQLCACLAAGEPADAVLMSDSDHATPREAVALVRALSDLPVVLFRNTNIAYEESAFDLVVQCLTPPEVWLDQVDALIERNRTALRPTS